jgi:hypothetical protein
MSDYLERTHNGTSFSGSDAYIFAASGLAKALKLYAQTGMQVNRAYTPTAMLKAATSYTGNRYKRKTMDYLQAHDDLMAVVDFMKAHPRVDD